MENFPSLIEFRFEPDLTVLQDGGEVVRLTMTVSMNGRQCSVSNIKKFDFMLSHFDIVWDNFKHALKKLLEER